MACSRNVSARDDCWISDLNPRVGTSLPLSLVAGHNPIAFLLNSRAASHHRVGSSGVPCGTLQEYAVPHLDLHQIRGVVFDFDDTLIDQKLWIARKLELTSAS